MPVGRPVVPSSALWVTRSSWVSLVFKVLTQGGRKGRYQTVSCDFLAACCPIYALVCLHLEPSVVPRVAYVTP